jgi:hypothetical protein
MRMSVADVYRVHACKCVQLAQRIADPDGKLVLLDMARAWLAIAEQADKNSQTTLVYETPQPQPKKE